MSAYDAAKPDFDALPDHFGKLAGQGVEILGNAGHTAEARAIFQVVQAYFKLTDAIFGERLTQAQGKAGSVLEDSEGALKVLNQATIIVGRRGLALTAAHMMEATRRLDEALTLMIGVLNEGRPSCDDLSDPECPIEWRNHMTDLRHNPRLHELLTKEAK